MSHLRESFPSLEDLATKEGRVLHEAVQGSTATGKSGAIGIAFKDSSGNLVLPQLTPEGKLPVDFEGAGVAKHASAATEIAGSLTEVLIAEISLTASKTIGRILAQGSCFKESVFKLYQQNDATTTLIGSCIVGPGSYTNEINLGIGEITSGAAGTQKLILKAINLTKESDFLGHVSCLEFAG